MKDLGRLLIEDRGPEILLNFRAGFGILENTMGRKWAQESYFLQYDILVLRYEKRKLRLGAREKILLALRCSTWNTT